MGLIKELIAEHREIETLIKEIKKLGVHTMEGRNILCSAKEKLMEHLQKEDNLLYPVLHKYAAKHPGDSEIIKIFEFESKTITSYAENNTIHWTYLYIFYFFSEVLFKCKTISFQVSHF